MRFINELKEGDIVSGVYLCKTKQERIRAALQKEQSKALGYF